MLLDSATERLSIATAYFAPVDFFLERLCAAAQCGVRVDLLLPGPHADKRACQLASEAAYDRLTGCAVRVWNFRPTMMHAKIMIVDGIAAAVGSLAADFDADLKRSEEIDLTRWRDRGPRQKLLEFATLPLRRYF